VLLQTRPAFKFLREIGVKAGAVLITFIELSATAHELRPQKWRRFGNPFIRLPNLLYLLPRSEMDPNLATTLQPSSQFNLFLCNNLDY